MKHRLAVLATTVVCAFGAAGLAAPESFVPVAHAKPCSAGWTHAALSWGHKCLRAGQFCKVSADREYHRYRYHCHNGRLRR